MLSAHTFAKVSQNSAETVAFFVSALATNARSPTEMRPDCAQLKTFFSISRVSNRRRRIASSRKVVLWRVARTAGTEVLA
eukprot:g11743.t1